MMTVQTATITFNVSFGGFYEGSLHHGYLESQVESYRDEDNPMCTDCDNNPNWTEAHNDAAVSILEYLSNHVGVDLEFVEVDSPKYYNYTTDKITANISEDDFELVANTYLYDDKFVEYVNKGSQHRDGFISHAVGIDAVIDDSKEMLLVWIFDYIVEQIKSDNDLNQEYYYAADDVTFSFRGCDCTGCKCEDCAAGRRVTPLDIELQTTRVEDTGEEQWVSLMLRGGLWTQTAASSIYKHVKSILDSGKQPSYATTPYAISNRCSMWRCDELLKVVQYYDIPKHIYDYAPPVWNDVALYLRLTLNRRCLVVEGGGLIVERNCYCKTAERNCEFPDHSLDLDA